MIVSSVHRHSHVFDISDVGAYFKFEPSRYGSRPQSAPERQGDALRAVGRDRRGAYVN